MAVSEALNQQRSCFENVAESHPLLCYSDFESGVPVISDWPRSTSIVRGGLQGEASIPNFAVNLERYR